MATCRIVIINYKTRDLTIDCLRSLAPEVAANPGVTVCVTDNASGDGSIDAIDAAIQANGWNTWAHVRPLERNGGFAYGNNGGIRPAMAEDPPPDYLLLLNPDTVVRPDGIGALLRFMEAHPDVGFAGSRLEDPDGTPQRSAFRFHSPVSEMEAGFRVGFLSRLLARHVVAPPVVDEPCEVDWVAAASIIIRPKVFDEVGLMDEAYFMYFEEVDWLLRARAAGWRCWYVPQSRVVHLVGQASGVTDKAKATRRRPAYWFESRHRYFVKNFPKHKAAAADLLFMLGFATWRLRRRLQRKPDRDPERMLWDFARHSVFARGFKP